MLTHINLAIEKNSGQFRHSSFTSLNLSMLDLENLEDEECLDALNKVIFERYFSKAESLQYSLLFKILEGLGGNYGYDGFHSGFGELLASLLTQDLYSSQ